MLDVTDYWAVFLFRFHSLFVSVVYVLRTSVMNYGCQHYRRKCKLVAPCCGEVFWCRHCHNEAKHDNLEVSFISFPVITSVHQDESGKHVLDRKAVTEVVCALCNIRQPIGSHCQICGVPFGQYYCPECRFFDDDISKEHFHCEKCGICRVGGRQNYFHCETCNCCYHNDLQVQFCSIQNLYSFVSSMVMFVLLIVRIVTVLFVKSSSLILFESCLF